MATRNNQGRPNLDIDALSGLIDATDLRANVKGVADRLRNTMTPALITIKGQAGFVVLSPELFQQIKVLLNSQLNEHDS